MHYCFLDCDDLVRIHRLRQRGSTVGQDVLNWASWMRMHHHQPSWESRVICEQGWSELVFPEYCHSGLFWPNQYQPHFIDTSTLSPEAVLQILQNWLKQLRG